MFLFSFFCFEIILKDHLRQKFRKCCSHKAGSLMVTSFKLQKENINKAFNKPAQTNNKLVLFIYLVSILKILQCGIRSIENLSLSALESLVFPHTARILTSAENLLYYSKNVQLHLAASPKVLIKVQRWAISIKQNLRSGFV